MCSTFIPYYISRKSSLRKFTNFPQHRMKISAFTIFLYRNSNIDHCHFSEKLSLRLYRIYLPSIRIRLYNIKMPPILWSIPYVSHKCDGFADVAKTQICTQTRFSFLPPSFIDLGLNLQRCALEVYSHLLSPSLPTPLWSHQVCTRFSQCFSLVDSKETDWPGGLSSTAVGK